MNETHFSSSASSLFNDIYITFDIHDVLANHKVDSTAFPLFQAYGMIVQVPVEGSDTPIPQYVYPFVKELFQLIAQTQGIHISFFTSADGRFARPFVKQLLTSSLGDERYAQIADTIKVFAKSDLKRFESYTGPFPAYAKYHVDRGKKCKDLRDVYPHAPADQRLLIDNDRTFSAPPQIKNIVQISGEQWTEEFERSQVKGSHLCKERLVLSANHILLLTGAIFSAWEESKKSQKPISKVLFAWQLETREKWGKLFSLNKLKERTELYWKGLELLRQINPQLQPITLKSFQYASQQYPMTHNE